jgi:hypothetical protein
MRIHSTWLAPLAALTLAIVSASDAAAQGFFQQLFGFSTPPAAEMPQSRPQPSLTPGGRPYNFPAQQSTPRRGGEDDDERGAKVGTLKTVCVRMCDGYYFPVSNATTKKGLFRDQMKCRSACGDEARLFHLPAGSTDVGEATDGNGRVYGLLNVAYKYRKSLVAGCQCRPAPWSEAEAARHQQYAEAEAVKSAAEAAQAAKMASVQEPAKPAPDAKAATVVADAVEAKAKPAKTTKLAGNVRAAANSSVAPTRRTQPSYAPTPPPSGAMALGGGGLVWPGEAPKRQ